MWREKVRGNANISKIISRRFMLGASALRDSATMTASSRGRRVAQTVLSSKSSHQLDQLAVRADQYPLAASPNLCARCASSSSRFPFRLYSTAAPVSQDVSRQTTTIPGAPPAVSPSPPSPYTLRSGMILTRPPLVTRPLHPFENAFFFYQKRLEERLNTPFITSIYFKPDTARQLDWNVKVEDRKGTVAKELGVYNGKSSKSWDDELKVGDELSSQENILNSLLKDAEARVSDDAELIAPEDVEPVEPPASRETEADKKGDVKRLDRALDKTLYLIVKGKDGWGFPADIIPKSENLHEVRRIVPFLGYDDDANIQ